MSNDDFELINNEIKEADNQSGKLVDDLAGMSFTSTIPPNIEKEVPEKIRLWREEKEIKLEEKDKMEQEAKEALRISATKEIFEWVSKYNDAMERTKTMNRSNENKSEGTDTMEDGTQNMWQSISSLCDFTKGPKAAKDASRMRSIFLHMKSAPKAN